MKKFMKFGSILILAMAFIVAFNSCEEEEKVLPTAGFTYSPATIVVGDIVAFTNITQDGDTYLWDFGDGETSTEKNITHSYTTADTYVVKLTATNADGNHSAEQTITVNEAAAAAFTYSPETVVKYEEVQFTNTSTNATSYTWDFGDGETSTEENPSHFFLSTGDVVVKLTATNDNSNNSTEQTITVNASTHVNQYTIDDTTYVITTDFFWYQSGMGGAPYLRLLTAVAGQDNPDLIKLYPSQGLGDIAQTYTWSADGEVGTYDHGYTGNYAGMNYDWTAIGKTGSSDLVIEEVVTNVYKITGVMILALGYFDWDAGVFVETGTATLTIDYLGGITPL